MTGVTWVKGSAAQFIQTPMKAVKQVTSNFNMESLVEDAANLMKDLIASRGRNRQWQNPWGGRSGSGPGRIDTGHMWSSVKYRVRHESDKIVGEFGWLDDQEMYFLYQEDGFTHWISGEFIPGMLALQDAGLQAKEEFVRRLTLAVRNG